LSGKEAPSSKKIPNKKKKNLGGGKEYWSEEGAGKTAPVPSQQGGEPSRRKLRRGGNGAALGEKKNAYAEKRTLKEQRSGLLRTSRY